MQTEMIENPARQMNWLYIPLSANERLTYHPSKISCIITPERYGAYAAIIWITIDAASLPLNPFAEIFLAIELETYKPENDNHAEN